MIYSTFSAGNSPCFGCTDRHVLCHAECDKYKGWKADLKNKADHEKSENSYQTYRRELNKEYVGRLWKGSHAYRRHYSGVPFKK